jgi:hypothetical protein
MTDESVPVPAPARKIRRILWVCTLAVLVFVSFTAGHMVALWPTPPSAGTPGKTPIARPGRKSEVPPKLPQLTDEAAALMNASGSEPKLLAVWSSNRGLISVILDKDSPQVRQVLRGKMADKALPARVRLLYAGILARLGEKDGRRFLIERARAATELGTAQDAFWMIGHLDWLHFGKGRPDKAVDMRWAEKFMVESLTSDAKLKVPADLRIKALTRWIALSDGNFGSILVKLKSAKAYSVLLPLYTRDRHGAALRALSGLDDKRLEPLFLKMLASGRSYEYRCAAAGLTHMKSRKAIPILLKRLDEPDTYGALATYNDARILPALRKALPKLQYARHEARLLIIELEGGDKLPKLLAIAREPGVEDYDVLQVMYRIEALKDRRAIPFATELLRKSPSLSKRWAAIEILGCFKSPPVVKTLIDALDVNYHSLAKSKDVLQNNNRIYRRRIRQYLKTMTGQDFGLDKAKWTKWYMQEHKRRGKKEGKAESFLGKHRKALAANPKGVKFEVRFRGKKRKFHPGEVIPLELVFSSSIPKAYRVLNKTYDRCGRDGSDAYVVDRPGDVADPLREYFDRSVFMGGGLYSWHKLDAKRFAISRELNEWLRFDRPGKYRLYVSTGRIGTDGKTPGVELRGPYTVSNVIEFEILKQDPEWAARELKDVVAELEEGGERMEARRRLRYLDTEAAIREKTRRMCRGDVNSHFSFGLIGSRRRHFAIKEMIANLTAPELPVRVWDLTTLALMAYYLKDPLPPPSKTKTSLADLGARYTARRIAQGKLRGGYVAILWRGLEKKRGEARKISTKTFWTEAVNARLLPAEVAKVIRKHAPGAFEKHLHPAHQHWALTYGWDRFRSPRMLPVLRRLYKSSDKGEYALKLRSAALPCLHDLSPMEGRELFLAEIRRARPRVVAAVLVRLPDKLLPELDVALTANLQNAADAAAAGVISLLMSRYASEKALPAVQKAYEKVARQWPKEAQAPLLAYFLRVKPELGVKKLQEAAAVEKGNRDEPWRSLLGDVAALRMHPEIERLALARLDGKDRFLAAAAARVLGRHGSVPARAALVKRLKKWHAKWRERKTELAVSGESCSEEVKGAQALGAELVNAIVTGRSWLTDPGRIAELEKLCLSSGPKWSVDQVRRKWKGGVAVGCALSGYGDLHLFVGQYQRLSLHEAKELLTRFPKGTKFRWVSNHIIGRAAKKRKQMRSAVQSHLTKLGMKLDPGKPDLW